MKVLPPNIQLSPKPIKRWHKPKHSRDYSVYRQCLRWDFGFTCAFCNLHESDFMRFDSEGYGITSIEHIFLKSTDEGKDKENNYSFLVYCCVRCNRARGTKPRLDENGRKLLNPTKNAWGDHFEVVGDSLNPISGDDAEYTEDAYNINSKMKRQLRDTRRKSISRSQNIIDHGPSILKLLIDKSRQEKDKDARIDLLKKMKALQGAILEAYSTLESYLIIPKDSVKKCRCINRNSFSIPKYIRDTSNDIQKIPAC